MIHPRQPEIENYDDDIGFRFQGQNKKKVHSG